MSSNEIKNENEESNIITNNIKKEKSPSSLKNSKFKGLTPEQMIKKYEDVLFSREKQFYELSNEITKLTQTIQNLVEKKNKSKYHNDKLKEILENNEKLLKQELSNKELAFMKLATLEHKYDDLQNKIEDIINKQNALAESKEKNDNEENDKKIKEENNIDNTIKNDENINNKEIKKIKEENNDIKEVKKETNKIEDKEKVENNKIEDKEKEKKEIIEKSKDNKDKKEGTFLSARERLNKLKEKKEKVQKLNLSEFINNNNNNS